MNDYLSEYPAEAPIFVDVRKLMEVAQRVADGAISDDDLFALDEAVEAVSLHFEDSDPKSMGWVGDDGLP